MALHCAASRGHTECIQTLVSIVVFAVLLHVCSAEGDALRGGSERFGCERLLADFLFRRSWICRRHQVLPINILKTFNKIIQAQYSGC